MKLTPALPVVDLKDPIKSAEFVLLEKIKNHRKAVGLKQTDPSREMPRTDGQGITNKHVEGAPVEKALLTLADREWLQEAQKHAILIAEINKAAKRQLDIEEIKLATEQHAKFFSELKIDEHIAANMARSKELQRVLRKHKIREDQDWREWIDKIDQKTLIHNRELVEILMRSFGFKMGYLPQPWNQKHLTEIKISLSKIVLEQLHKAQLEHLRQQQALDDIKFESLLVKTEKNQKKLEMLTQDKILDLEIFKAIQQKTQADSSYFLLMKAMGLNVAGLPLPRTLIKIHDERQQLANVKFKLERNKLADLKEYRKKLAELQSAALDTEGRQLVLKLIDRKAEEYIDREDLKLQRISEEHGREIYRAMMKSLGYEVGFIPLPEKQTEIVLLKKNENEQARLKKNESQDQLEQLFQSGVTPSEASEKAAESMNNQSKTEGTPEGEIPPSKPKGFRNAFQPMSSKKIEFSNQEEELARIKMELERKQQMGLADFQNKMAQLQSASQLAQANARAIENPAQDPKKIDVPVDIKQRVKAS